MHKSASDPQVSIIILTKNGCRYLAEILEAIYAQDSRFAFEILLIDSGSTDGTLDIAQRYPVSIHCIAPETFNHGATRNLGGQLAARSSRYLVFLTQDATPLPGWLDNLVAPLEAEPQVAGTFSRHVPRPDCNPILARQICDDWEQCGTPARIVKHLTDPIDFERRKIHYVYFADTSSCLHRQAWERYPFPVTSFAEDAQWAELVLRAGHTLIYEPSSAVLHSHSFSLRQHFERNREHAQAMRGIGAVKGIRGVPGVSSGMAKHAIKTITRDWRWLWAEPTRRWWSRVYWSAYSPVWHAAAGVGSWLGSTRGQE